MKDGFQKRKVTSLSLANKSSFVLQVMKMKRKNKVIRYRRPRR